MTDEFDDLKAAMRAATPDPDPAKKSADLALAQKNFASHQEYRDGARPTSEETATGLLNGVKFMFNALTTRGGLTATTALVAAGFMFLTPLGQDILSPPAPDRFRSATENTSQQVNEAEAMAGAESSLPEPVVQMPAVTGEAGDSLPEPVVEAPVIVEETRNALTATAPAQLQSAERQLSKTAVAPVPSADLEARGTSVLADGGPTFFEHPVSPLPEAGTEEFSNEDPSPVFVTAETPVSTFSVDVDTASYAVIRNSLSNGMLPDPRAVRIEEMINYFTYDYAAPDTDVPFRPTVRVSPTPWNSDTQLLQIGIQGTMPLIDDRPPLNLVFLIDTSGSMNRPDKLPLLKQSFRLMLGQLRPQDEISIVTYAGSAGQVLAPTPASDRTTILNALETLNAGGSTAGQAGLVQAYRTASAMAEDGEVSRVILATDGDFNVGLSDPEDLKNFIAGQRDSGTFLSVLGFGRGNLDDATMQALAQNGNGQAAYIDTLAEAQKVLVDQLTGALFPIANDVKIQIEFNPAQVAEYRLIGYETRALRREDFNNDAVDAGEIGAGHSVTALYEVTPPGSPARLSDPLRYAPAVTSDGGAELGFLRVRYKTPGTGTSQLIEQPVYADAEEPDANGFAAAIAGFGQLLAGGNYLGDWGYGDAIAAATATRGDDTFGYRAEAIRLMRVAQSLDAQ